MDDQNTVFSGRLQQAMTHKALSIRALAKLWRPDENVETTRRSLNRYLHGGVVPREQIRRELAEVLSVPPEHFLVGGPDDSNPFRDDA